MHSSNPAFTSPFAQKSDSAFDDLTATLGDMRPHPTEEALVQLGRALMTELLDLISDTALEDFQTLLGEALIGAFHSAAGRIEPGPYQGQINAHHRSPRRSGWDGRGRWRGRG